MPGTPFQLGNKHGRGRPPGSRNQVASKSQAILEEHAEILMKKCIHMALEGDGPAMRLCVERLTPIRRQRVLRFKMPRVGTMAEVDTASQAVVKGVALGKLTPSEGEAFAGMLEGRRKMIETEQFEVRLRALEEAQNKPAAKSLTDNPAVGLGDLKKPPSRKPAPHGSARDQNRETQTSPRIGFRGGIHRDSG
jgi:hypothetical protein